MKITTLNLLLLIVTTSAFPQKNVSEASNSALTGISLPAGSKLDKRILSVAAARTLIDMKAKEIGSAISGTVEVMAIPFTSGEKAKDVLNKLPGAGFSVEIVKGEPNYYLLKGKGKYFLIYLADGNSTTEFYVSEVSSPTVIVEKQAANNTVERQVEQQAIAPEKPMTQIVDVRRDNSAIEAKGFTFTSTNFTDGWVAVPSEEYVLVTRENVRVRLYYTVEMTEQMRPPVTEVNDYFWNKIVVPEFKIVDIRKLDEGFAYFKTNYIYGDVVERSTGKKCSIAISVIVNSGIAQLVLVIAPDKATFDSYFPKPESLGAMTGYNRFAISLQDVSGKWKESSNAAANYYNVNTGAYMGMSFAASAAEFNFFRSGEYRSHHSGAMGQVGTMRTFDQEYKGTMKVLDWELALTNRFEGKTDVFEAWFEAVRGGRLLHLVNKQYQGIRYTLVRTAD